MSFKMPILSGEGERGYYVLVGLWYPKLNLSYIEHCGLNIANYCDET
jgi:hypothetical protein